MNVPNSWIVPVNQASVTGNAPNPGQRYKLWEEVLNGVLYSVGPAITYGGGQGVLREVTIVVNGAYGNAYVPVTLFNEDANTVSDAQVGRAVECRAMLSSRMYVDKNGNDRWNLSMACRSIKVDSTEESVKTQNGGTDLTSDPDDLPF